jgi:hypothetical protein
MSGVFQYEADAELREFVVMGLRAMPNDALKRILREEISGAIMRC